MGIRHNSNDRLEGLMYILNRYDYLFFFIAPVILTVIYLLPMNIKEVFTLNPSHPTLLTMFLSNYTQIGFSGYAANLINYLILIFLIFNIKTNKKILYLSSFLIFIVLPFISSFLSDVYFILHPSIWGFSAIVAGFTGYFLYAVYNYLKSVLTVPVKGKFLWLLLVINFSIVGIFNSRAPIFTKIIFVIISIAFLLINLKTLNEIYKHYIKEFKELANYSLIKRLYRVFFFLLAFICLFSLHGLIPLEIKKGNITINILAHYVGYFFGLVIPLVIEKALQFHQSGEKLSWRISR
ncbi:hypothetical protein BMS3Bbin15_00771 [archaeon BMS3Bbin15]|nr:hypothetical protein BMS3Bbin15_00771 [archaeon BMS3Bbin15]